MRKIINEIFAIKDTLEDEKRKFVQRINSSIFEYVKKNTNKDYYDEIFKYVCYHLGIDSELFLRGDPFFEVYYPELNQITNNDFKETLTVICIIYKYFLQDNQLKKLINEKTIQALQIATLDLGIKWKDGLFYPIGANLLDEKLLEESLIWLKDYPNERTNFANALTSYENKKMGDAINNCYLTIEGLTRKFLNNNKVLDYNNEELLKKLNLSQEWKALINNYIKYANEYARHASDSRHKLNPNEVEAYLYFTGLIVRLIVKQNQKNSTS